MLERWERKVTRCFLLGRIKNRARREEQIKNYVTVLNQIIGTRRNAGCRKSTLVLQRRRICTRRSGRPRKR